MTCPECADGCYPYYGGAPGSDYAGPAEHDIETSLGVIPKGSFIFVRCEPAPKSEWPANFREDPDCPGFGTWFCPVCGVDDEVPQ